jgi:spore germination protein GerM
VTVDRIRWLRVAATAVLVALGIGCGVPADGTATPRDPDDVRFGLLDPEPPAPPVGAGSPISVYLVVDEDAPVLAPVDRRVPAPVDLSERLLALVEGPTEAERQAGLTTAIPADVDVIESVSVNGGIAEVELDAEFGSIPAEDQVIAIAQVVYTLTAAPGVGRVSFLVDGEPVDVPRGDGTLTSDSVSRDAYAFE